MFVGIFFVEKVGKLLVLDASFNTKLGTWIWVIVLGSSLVSIVGFARAGSVLFWKAHGVLPDDTEPKVKPPAIMSYVAVGILIALLAAHTVSAGVVHGYTKTMATQLFAPTSYISTVINTPGKLSKPKKEN